MLSTGMVGINAAALREIGGLGVRRLNYATDDPWNPYLRSHWFFAALREYDHVFSVRRANLVDLVSHGCRNVAYVPFGFDADLFFPELPTTEECRQLAADVLFVGGAEPDRVSLIAVLTENGFNVALYGDYWNRHNETRLSHRGRADPALLRKSTAATKVALCLVRRANRDGQVMRSYETAAVGACMLVEETAEHRDLFGKDGDAVVYFDSKSQMLDRLRWLLDHPRERQRLAIAVRRVIEEGGHTYDDRLATMLREAA
jgi:spore maturation protein CgeB